MPDKVIVIIDGSPLQLGDKVRISNGERIEDYCRLSYFGTINRIFEDKVEFHGYTTVKESLQGYAQWAWYSPGLMTFDYKTYKIQRVK